MTEFKPGDEIYGTCDGSFAEYARAQVGLLARKPANLSFEQAATAPVSGVTALQGVRDRAQLRTGEIIGASGGVGTFAVQIAKALGAEGTGVCSTAKMDLVRGLGADHVVDYSRYDFAGDEQRYDAILDIGGNSRLSHLRRALSPGGRLVIVGGETDGQWLGPFDRQLRAMMLSPLVTQKLGILGAKENSADLPLIVIYAVFLLLGVLSIVRSLSFGLALGMSRRSYYTGTVLFVVSLAAVYGLALALLQAVERATGGWGVQLYFFQPSYIFGGAWYLTWLTSFVGLALLFIYGTWFGIVYRRWNLGGLTAFVIAQATVVLVGASAATLNHAWGSIGHFFARLGAAGLTGVSAALAVGLLAGAYAIVRRVTV